MKKYLAGVLSAAMAVALAGCGSSSSAGSSATASADAEYMSNIKVADIKLKDTKNLVEATAYQLQTMDYVVTALAEDHEYNANFVDGLLENDKYGNLAPCLATGYSVSDDGLTYDFYLRKGVKWVTNSGEEYAEVKAQDFVTGLRHGAEFDSGTAWLLDGVIKGYSDYRTNAKWTDEEWDKVGVKAVDDYTVEYTLEKPTPYFPAMTTYAVLYPINQEFLETMGDGCALGSPDTGSCSFGTTEADSILYNGGFILDTYDAKSSIVLKKNDAYWDADNIKVDSVTRIYDDGSDPYSQIRNFEQGVYDAAPINASWENFDEYMKKYDGYTYQSLPNNSCFGIVFNFNRQSFDQTNYASDESLRENTHKAILDENFRKALRAAWDRQAYLSVAAPSDLAKAMLRNINDDPEIVRTSDGTTYGDLVEKAYSDRTGETVDLSDGQNPWDPSTVQGYLDAAKKDGITFPVHLDMLVQQSSKRLTDQAQSLKKSVEDNTDGNIIVELIMCDDDTIKNIAYYNTDPAAADYDISTFTGWSPDYPDPKTFVDIYSPVTGYYMTACGLTNSNDDSYGTDDDIKKQIGMDEYQSLYEAADAIYDDLDARYAAFAKADAEMIDKAFFIPGQMQSRTVNVTHVVPFSRVYSKTGLTEYKYKGLELQEGVVSSDDYNKAYEDFKTGGTAADLVVKK